MTDISKEAVNFLTEQHEQVCHETGDDLGDTAYSIGAQAILEAQSQSAHIEELESRSESDIRADERAKVLAEVEFTCEWAKRFWAHADLSDMPKLIERVHTPESRAIAEKEGK